MSVRLSHARLLVNCLCGAWGSAIGFLATAVLLVTPGYGGTIRHDVSDSEYTALADESPFASVGMFEWSALGSNYMASGTLIDQEWVLTAAHVVEDITSSNIDTMTFTLGDDVYSVTETYYHSGWNGSTNNGDDIALVRLASAVTDVAPAYLYQNTDELHQLVTVVGYGATGTGLTGGVFASGAKRAGTNVAALGSVLNDIAWTGGGNDDMLVADFDSPGETGDPLTDLIVPTDLEYCAAPGDSGGAWFIEDGGIYYVAGVTSFLASNPGSSEYSMYGDVFGSARVSSYLDWIAQYVDVSEPVPGDANGDGVVNESDAAILTDHWGQSGYWTEGDFNGDGVVDVCDAAILAANWQGDTENAAVTVIPEPSVLLLLATAFCCAPGIRFFRCGAKGL